MDWKDETQTLHTTPTLQVVVNPQLRRGSPIHDAAFANLKELGAEYVRYVPWHPYPRLAVAELEPPTKDKTSWAFSLIDPMTIDFLKATDGHETILNFSTIPAWMYDAKKPIVVPQDPDWDYTQGKALRDPSRKELAGYYARLVGWYTKGGFTDGCTVHSCHGEAHVEFLIEESCIHVRKTTATKFAPMTRHGVEACRLVGNDSVLTTVLTEGLCDGVVSGVACVMPELILSLNGQDQRIDSVDFRHVSQRLDEFIAQLNVFPTPWA